MIPKAARTSISGGRELIDAEILQRQPHQRVVEPVEASLLERLASERLHDLRAGEGLLQQHEELADPLLGTPIDPVESPTQCPDDDARRRKHRGGDQREHPLAGEHDHEQAR